MNDPELNEEPLRTELRALLEQLGDELLRARILANADLYRSSWFFRLRVRLRGWLGT